VAAKFTLGCSGPLVAMSQSCPHAIAVKRWAEGRNLDPSIKHKEPTQ
jgi:hypothetical protein